MMTRRNLGFALFCSICLTGFRLTAGFVWTGYIVMNPENGIVETGNSISMEIIDSFEVTDLPDGENPISEGEPTYEWFVNGSDTPCKTGKQVTFTTGDSNADIPTGDFTVEVKGSRTYTIPTTGCTCGCDDPSCRCQELKGQSDCRGCAKLKSDKSRTSKLQTRDGNVQDFRIERHLLEWPWGLRQEL